MGRRATICWEGGGVRFESPSGRLYSFLPALFRALPIKVSQAKTVPLKGTLHTRQLLDSLHPRTSPAISNLPSPTLPSACPVWLLIDVSVPTQLFLCLVPHSCHPEIEKMRGGRNVGYLIQVSSFYRAGNLSPRVQR